MFDTVAATVAALADATGLPCSTRVPAKRPSEFVTVERTGGAVSWGKDSPNLAVQAWADTDLRAATLAKECAVACLRMRETVPQVCKVEVGSIYDFADPDGGMCRYQVDVYVTARL